MQHQVTGISVACHLARHKLDVSRLRRTSESGITLHREGCVRLPASHQPLVWRHMRALCSILWSGSALRAGW